MGHYQQGAPATQPEQAAQHLRLAGCIEAGGGLVEQQQRRRREQPASQAQALPLAAGQQRAAGADIAVPALRPGLDLFQQANRPRRLAQRFEIGVRSRHAQVPGNAAAEQAVVLEHQVATGG